MKTVIIAGHVCFPMGLVVMGSLGSAESASGLEAQAGAEPVRGDAEDQTEDAVDAAKCGRFSLSVTPNTPIVRGGWCTTFTVDTNVTTPPATEIKLSLKGLPAGDTASFKPNPVTAGESSTLTVCTAACSSPGATTSVLTITGKSPCEEQSATVELTTVCIICGEGEDPPCCGDGDALPCCGDGDVLPCCPPGQDDEACPH